MNTTTSDPVIRGWCILLCACLAFLMFKTQMIAVIFLPIIVPALLLVLRFPIWICLFFIVFSFFRIHEAIPTLNPLRIPQLLALAALAGLVWHAFISKQLKLNWHPLMGYFGTFFALVVLGAIFATDRAESFAALSDTFVKIAVMLLAICWFVRSPADFRLATLLFIAAGVLIGSIAIYNKLNGIGLVEGSRVTIGRNIGSMIGDPNDLALVLTFPLSFATALLFGNSLSARVRWCLVLPTVIVIAWAIICTQSRGGLLGMTTVSAIMLWFHVKNKAIVVSIGVVLFVVLMAVAGISGRASGGQAEDGIDESAMGRIYAWQAATAMATHRPLYGVGINNFYANYYFYSPHWDGKNHAVHSTWFQILAETGILGFVVFIRLLWKSIQQAWRNRVQSVIKTNNADIQVSALAFLSGLFSFCVSGTFLTQGFTWPLYILIALTIALTRYLDTADEQQFPVAPVEKAK